MYVLLAACYISPMSFTNAAATPTPDITALQTISAPAWVSGPNERGTWELLYGCVFMLVLCVYTAIHLNVPAHHDTQLRYWLRKVKWVGIAIIAPEIVVYTVFEQWYHSRKFLKQLRMITELHTNRNLQVRFNAIFLWSSILTSILDWCQLRRNQTKFRHGLCAFRHHGRICFRRQQHSQLTQKSNTYPIRNPATRTTWFFL